MPLLFSRRHTTAISDQTAGLLDASKIQLRPYQEDCITAVLDHLKQGHKRLGISLATGSGKTVIFTQLIDRIPSTGDRTRTLILAHRQELVDQAYKHCAKAYPNKSIEIELGKSRASGLADITVASLQSITSRDRILKFNPSRFKLVLVDEAHHIVAPRYLNVLKHFNLRHLEVESPALLGVSATFSRSDGLKLGSVIDHIVYHKDYIEMINDKWLAEVLFTTVELRADLRSLPTTSSGDFATPALSRAINTPANNEATVHAWLTRASTRLSTLVFCIDTTHVRSLTAAFRAHNLDARYITSSTPAPERAALLAAFRNREFPLLLNCAIFTEGTDIPGIDCILLARPTRSRNLLTQMLGRGLRLHPEKRDCHVIDMVAALATGVVSVPTLFGLEPNLRLTAASPAQLQAQVAEAQAAEAQAAEEALDGHLAFTDYPSLSALLADRRPDRKLRSLSPHAWVQVNSSRFILTTQSGDYLSVNRDPSTSASTSAPMYRVCHVLKLRPHAPGPHKEARVPYARPHLIADAPSLQAALAAADAYAHGRFPRYILDWRRQRRGRPASEAQMALLAGLLKAEEGVKLKGLTMGEAGDLITKLKFGAKGLVKKAAVARRKVERGKKMEGKLGLGGVRVGPLAGEAGDSGTELEAGAVKSGAVERRKAGKAEKAADTTKRKLERAVEMARQAAQSAAMVSEEEWWARFRVDDKLRQFERGEVRLRRDGRVSEEEYDEGEERFIPDEKK
ncbi:ResIII-domain-containing protein [Trichodelitschia bisporula]|uniref:ResIII-domain-containing protein n=1 Tax=Trichodelitschia bisporula TaxID=703511 RepID=A0A6G1I1U2_9PEZI|nr:ResIII-domain-containing protein [Trichodelitschia bisporula]